MSPGALFQFSVLAPSTAIGTQANTFTVTAEDQFNNVLTNYAGTVTLTSSDSAAVYVPKSSTLTSGVGKFSVSLVTVGSQTLTASDSQNPAIKGTALVNVSAVWRNHFAFNLPSNTTTAGNPLIGFVIAEDQFNNTATSFSGTVNLSTTDTQAATTGGLTSPASLSNGFGFFAVVLKTAGTQTITASIPSVSGIITGTTNPGITVVGLPASQLVVTPVPPLAFPGVPAAYPNIPGAASSFASTGIPVVFTVQAEDQFNNVDPHYTGTVKFTSSDSAILPGNGLPVNAVLTSGSGTFSATLKTPGSQSITATDINNAGISGHSGAIVTRGLVVTSFAVTPTGFTVSFNKAFNPSVVNLYTTGHRA